MRTAGKPLAARIEALVLRAKVLYAVAFAAEGRVASWRSDASILLLDIGEEYEAARRERRVDCAATLLQAADALKAATIDGGRQAIDLLDGVTDALRIAAREAAEPPPPTPPAP